MYSLFEEQIIHESLELDHFLTRSTDAFAEALSYLPDSGTYSLVPEKYLDQVSALKKALSIPVIGSLNGVSRRRLDPLCPPDPGCRRGRPGTEPVLHPDRSRPEEPRSWKQPRSSWWQQVKRQHHHPSGGQAQSLLSPPCPNFAGRLAEAGANGLVLFNRFYQPDFDLDELAIVPQPGPEHLHRAAAASALDLHPAWQDPGGPGLDQRRAYGTRMCSRA